MHVVIELVSWFHNWLLNITIILFLFTSLLLGTRRAPVTSSLWWWNSLFENLSLALFGNTLQTWDMGSNQIVHVKFILVTFFQLKSWLFWRLRWHLRWWLGSGFGIEPFLGSAFKVANIVIIKLLFRQCFQILTCVRFRQPTHSRIISFQLLIFIIYVQLIIVSIVLEVLSVVDQRFDVWLFITKFLNINFINVLCDTNLLFPFFEKMSILCRRIER